MKVSLVLHLYQPPVQEEGIVKQIASECYLPLIKLIKNTRNHKFTLNIPLSLLEQMEKCGHTDWISDIKSLYEAERLELIGSAAYHPLLTKLPKEIIEQQIALNEYGLGYYFGSRHGFEGEPSIMIKNIQGFFPPELAVNNELVEVLSEFGYKWFLAEKNAIPKDLGKNESIFGFKDKSIVMVCRDRTISNIISFKRTPSIEDLSDYLGQRADESAPLVIALDAEYFGHHYRGGMFILESLLDRLEELGSKLVPVSEIVEDYEFSEIEKIKECGWGSSDEEFNKKDLYPFWIDRKNDIQTKLWDIQNAVVTKFLHNYETLTVNDFHTTPVWDYSALDSIQDIELRNKIYEFATFHKSLHSDKYWWASKKEILGRHLYDKSFLIKSLDVYKEYLNYSPVDDSSALISTDIEELKGLLT